MQYLKVTGLDGVQRVMSAAEFFDPSNEATPIEYWKAVEASRKLNLSNLRDLAGYVQTLIEEKERE